MEGTAQHSQDYGDIYDLSRRDSKRRRLLGRRLAEDQSNPDLQWHTAQHAPNFFAVTSTRPNRMDENAGIVPPPDLDWLAQTQGQPPASMLPYAEASSDGSQPFYFGQTQTMAYNPIPWPSSSDPPGIYDMNDAYATSLVSPVQEAQPFKFQDGAQYLNPLGGSEAMYNTSNTAFASRAVSLLPASYSLQAQPTLRDKMGRISISHSATTQILTQLDSVSNHIIQSAAKHNHAEFQDLLQGKDAAGGEIIDAINLFRQAFDAIGGEQGFVDVAGIQNFSPSQQDVVRKANTTNLILSVLGGHNISFFQLNKLFLDTFVPLGHRLLKWQGAIYLELKTQTYIIALLSNGGLPDPLLDELFPTDLDSQILQRHPDAPSLSPSEQDFVDRCRARRQYLLDESHTSSMRAELPHKYQWIDFVREFSNCLSKNVEHILSSAHRQSALHGSMNRRRAGSGPVLRDGSNTNGSASTDVKRSISSGGHDKRTVNGQTIRQAWTTPEEAALIAGLEHVGGPHWSQILALYGRGGSISEVLKDRNQVQLKDKARNLKLWYLKMGQEVPISLRGVTGELRKRGGARARAALEAEEQNHGKERRSSDDADAPDSAEAMLDVRHDTVDPGAYFERARNR